MVRATDLFATVRQESVLSYITEQLLEGHHVAAGFFQAAQHEAGSFASTLPAGLPKHALEDPISGPSSTDGVVDRTQGLHRLADYIATWLHDDVDRVFIAEDSLRSRKHLQGITTHWLEDSGSIYHVAASSSSIEDVEYVLAQGYSPLRSLGFLTKLDPGTLPPSGGTWISSEARAAGASATLATIGAYDGAGYLIWERP